jgi:hypothetical protein
MRRKDDGRDSKETKQTALCGDWSWQVNNSANEESDPSQHDNQSKESERAAQSQNTTLDKFM